jgi:hypothetical protein
MSLRAVHVLFILLSVGLSGWFGKMNLDAYRADPADASALFWCRAGFWACGILAVYGVWFLFKTRKLLLLIAAAGLLAPSEVMACAVCMGDRTSSVASAANGAIFVMLGVLVLVLGSCGWFLFRLASREKRPSPPYAAFAGLGSDIKPGDDDA